MFDDETDDLFRDLQSLPKNTALRKLNDLSKRARLAKVHAYITAEVKNQLPLFGKVSKKNDMLRNLSILYHKIQNKHRLAPGDFPDVNKMQILLSKYDFARFKNVKPRLIQGVDRMLKEDISQLMELLPLEQECADEREGSEVDEGGAFELVWDPTSPFGYKRGEGANAGISPSRQHSTLDLP